LTFSLEAGSIDYRYFLLTLRPHPSTTLLPYTTLFRSRRNISLPPQHQIIAMDHLGAAAEAEDQHDVAGGFAENPGRVRGIVGGRSEEHTSELQSLAYLVCRLLLEKKKATR